MKVIGVVTNQANVQVTNIDDKQTGGVNEKVLFKTSIENLPVTIYSIDGLIDTSYEGPIELEGNFTTSVYNNKVYGQIEVHELYQLQRVKSEKKPKI